MREDQTRELGPEEADDKTPAAESQVPLTEAEIAGASAEGEALPSPAIPADGAQDGTPREDDEGDVTHAGGNFGRLVNAVAAPEHAGTDASSVGSPEPPVGEQEESAPLEEDSREAGELAEAGSEPGISGDSPGEFAEARSGVEAGPASPGEGEEQDAAAGAEHEVVQARL